MQKFTETAIPQNYSTGLYNEHAYDVVPAIAAKMGNVIFEGISTLLGKTKSKACPKAFIFRDFNKEFLAAAVVEYEANEDPKQPGAWNYYWTWNEEDVPENADKTDANQAENASYFRGVSQGKYSFGFNNMDAIYTMTTYLMKVIKDWLNANANDKEEVGLELEGVFQARVVVENGEKIMSIEPDGEMKKLIKDDAALEVA